MKPELSCLEEALSIFAVFTFNTDYILVKKDVAPQAVQALKQAGYPFSG